jgi:hypothetical protein
MYKGIGLVHSLYKGPTAHKHNLSVILKKKTSHQQGHESLTINPVTVVQSTTCSVVPDASTMIRNSQIKKNGTNH